MNAIDIRITRARSALVMRHPFFGSLAMRLRVAQRSDIDTMATDGEYLFYRPTGLDPLDEATIMFIVAHEVLHCALGHHTRRGSRDHELWNIACDYVVNLMLHRAGFSVPPYMYLNLRFDGLNAEGVYRVLAGEKTAQTPQPDLDEASDDQQSGEQSSDGDEPGEDGAESDQASDDNDAGDDDGGDDNAADGDDAGDGEAGGDSSDPGSQPTQQGQGDVGSGDYAESHGDPGRGGEVLDAAPEHDKAALAEASDEWDVFTRQAVNIARRQGEGKLPGFIEELVEQLNEPRTDWRDVLRRFVEPSNTKDYSWTSPNRRLMSIGYYAPGIVSDGVNHLGIAIDTSGSVDQERLKQFGGETQAALDRGAIDKVTLVFTDTQVNRTAEYVTGEQIDFTVRGRGGTRFAPSFEWFNENAPDIAAAIYFTDLECSDFGPTPHYPVLWAACGDPRDIDQHAKDLPFGECVALLD